MTARYSRIIPSLIFFHIPFSTALDFQSSHPGGRLNPHKNPGINDDIPLDAQGDGGAVLETLRQIRGLRASFSGHDHGLDWCFRPRRLAESEPEIDFFHCFGRHTGYGGYGSWTRGSRVVHLDLARLDREIETWIRLEDGRVTGEVVLNRTFGEDQYGL